MKKILFTSISVLIACIAIFMSCTKSSTTTSNQTATATTTTGGTSANTLVVDGTSHSVTTGTTIIGSTYSIVSNTTVGNYPSISLYFAGTSAPTAGSYTANANYPTNGNSNAILTPSSSITWTVVTCHMTVTSGSSRNVSFTNSTFTDGTTTHIVTANLPF